MESKERRLLSTPEAAALIGIAPATLEGWRQESRGPRFIKVSRGTRGGLVRYRLADILRWMDAHLVETRETARVSR